jgi:hypothetical protein
VSRDNIPAIVLNQWETTADYLDDDLLDGVMPVLFADDVRAAEAAILEAPLKAKRDLERLAKVYFVPETLDLNQAKAIVRKPRLGEVIFWFKNLNLERLFAEDRLAAAYNTRNRATLQEASATCSTGVSGGIKKKLIIKKRNFLILTQGQNSTNSFSSTKIVNNIILLVNVLSSKFFPY